jgi:hypothetical protein
MWYSSFGAVPLDEPENDAHIRRGHPFIRNSMARILPVLLSWAMLSLTAASSAAGQRTQDSIRLQKVASAGGDIVHWTFDEGTGQQTIYLKNIGKHRPVTISAWRVFDCDNIKRRSCGEHTEGPALQPGQTVRLAVIRQQDVERPYSFRYDFTARYADDQKLE